nr:hypothetical protein [Tanacetum cinerariifolium]
MFQSQSFVPLLTPSQLVPKAYQVKVGKCNSKADLNKHPCSKSCKIVEEILKSHPLLGDLNLIVDAPIIYMRQFWYTVRKVEKEKETSRFQIDQQEVHFTLDMFRKLPNFSKETAANPFMRPADFTTIKKFLKINSYEAEYLSATRFFIKHLTRLWKMLLKFLNCCTTTRITGA